MYQDNLATDVGLGMLDLESIALEETYVEK
jgi:hypothetical protein